MLENWSLKHFKPIVDSGELHLAPLTIVAGPNSSGKSSVLQSILMITQTLSSRVLEQALLPQGPIVRLGTFQDILNKQSASPTMTISFTLEPKQEGANAANSVQHLFRDSVSLITSIKVKATFSANRQNAVDGVKGIDVASAVVEQVSLEIGYTVISTSSSSDPTPHSFIFSVTMATEEEFSDFLKNVSPLYQISLPYAPGQPLYQGHFMTPDGKASEVYLVALSHFLPTRLVRKFNIENTDTMGLESVSHNIFAEYLERAVQQITTFFTRQVRYLGPLRADPHVFQQMAPSSELDDVGAKGEYAAAVYDVHQETMVTWFNPFSQRVEQDALSFALNRWLHYLGIAHTIRVHGMGQGAFSWQVSRIEGQAFLPLAAIGVGMSQILPILVMGLLAPPETLLMIEQPELHLHPKAQARLGDFFMGLAQCAKQCLIETHSENLVTQLRYYIVRAHEKENQQQQIYFVDQNENGIAQFETVKISAQGNILNWPEGFFDETLLQEDMITDAYMQQREMRQE